MQERKKRVLRERASYFSRYETELSQPMPCDRALDLLLSMPKLNFVETVEVALALGIDPKRSDQGVRGSVVLPNGTGRKVKVAVFATGEDAEAAKEAGADAVGLEDLSERIRGGDCPFQVIITHPSHMVFVSKLGPILGPKGLMPNPKLGTVTLDVAGAVRAAKAGQVTFRNDKAGIIHARLGKMDFSKEALLDNLEALVASVRRLKPAGSKGVFIKQVTLSTTMGPGVMVQVSSLPG